MSGPVLRPAKSGGYFHHCPGCNEPHRLPEGWHFNGDLVRPTFSPSFKHTWRYGGGRTERCCHYIVTAGMLHFCGDSTHALAGQIVSIPQLPENLKTGDY